MWNSCLELFSPLSFVSLGGLGLHVSVFHWGQLLNELTSDSTQSDRLLFLNRAGAHRSRKPWTCFMHTDIINVFLDHLGFASGLGTWPPQFHAGLTEVRLCQPRAGERQSCFCVSICPYLFFLTRSLLSWVLPGTWKQPRRDYLTQHLLCPRCRWLNQTSLQTNSL